MSARIIPFEGHRNIRLGQVNARYERFLAAGFPLAAYPGETIQCQNELDRTNWMELRDICRGAEAAGFGDALIPEPGIRCTSNAFVRPTHSETLAILEDLRDWALRAQANWWRLKDLVRDAASRDEVYRIDLEEGWP